MPEARPLCAGLLGSVPGWLDVPAGRGSRPRAVRAVSLLGAHALKPGQALPPPTGTAARLYSACGTLHTGLPGVLPGQALPPPTALSPSSLEVLSQSFRHFVLLNSGRTIAHVDSASVHITRY